MKSVFGNFIIEHNSIDKASTDVINELTKMFDIRFRSTSHKRPPKIIIFGPVGCGRTTQATLLSKNYGIVLINVKNLLK